MRTFEKIVSIEGYRFRIIITANETNRPGRWLIQWVDVKNVENNRVVYRSSELCYTNPTLKNAFKLAARAAKKALVKNREINKEIKELEEWDGVVNF